MADADNARQSHAQSCRERRTAALATAAALALAAVTAAVPAHAAVRQCDAFIARAAEHPTSEHVARQSALAEWTAAARKLGPAYDNWRLSIERSLSCLRLPDGTHRCQAMARPCGITQVPGAKPPGTPPEPPAPAKSGLKI